MSFLKIVLCLAFITILAWACGPSIRRTYQSDNAFSRCFDMDYNPAASIAAKTHCWSAWKQKYIYNQPDDKQRYAELRLAELAKGISDPGPPGPPGAFHQRPKPKPKKSEKPKKETAPQDAAQLGQCEKSCKDAQKTCAEACMTDAGVTPPPCQNACNAGYKTCMRACFKAD